MSWEDVNKALDKTLTAIIACRKAAQQAQNHADEAQVHYEECQYWANKFQKKLLLFQEKE